MGKLVQCDGRSDILVVLPSQRACPTGKWLHPPVLSYELRLLCLMCIWLPGSKQMKGLYWDLKLYRWMV